MTSGGPGVGFSAPDVVTAALGVPKPPFPTAHSRTLVGAELETGVSEPTSSSRVTLQGCRALREEACARHWPLGVSRKFHPNR